MEAEGFENLEFKWGKKRGVGGKKKEVQFYESFTYNGDDYNLHDCVYMYKEGEPEPYIGKLIKIWANANSTKKVKVQWFFRPSEISNWLKDDEALENEIFLASGEGVGLANVNPLEAIAGKCNVVCISKDNRNPQPSETELQMADFIFYRTFDVRDCKISDKMDDNIGGLEVKFVFNRKENEQISCVPKLFSVEKEDIAECKHVPPLSRQYPAAETEGAGVDKISSLVVAKGSADVNDSLVKWESSSKGKSASTSEKSIELASTSVQTGTVSGEKTTSCKYHTAGDEVKVNPDQVGVKDDAKFASESGAPQNSLSKKSMVDDSAKSLENANKSSTHNLIVHGNDVTASLSTTNGKKMKTVPGKDSMGSDKGVKYGRETDGLEHRPSKKAKVESSAKLVQKKNSSSVQKLSINAVGDDAKDLPATLLSSDDNMKSKVAMQKSSEMVTKLPNSKLLKGSVGYSKGEDWKNEGEGFEVTPTPDDERSRWFRALPWEERMKKAHELGALVLLSNLDPEYTSAEVKDIVRHAFNENCTAKMVQHTAISSPLHGQAFIILKNRGAAERIVQELQERCLMLPNGRPLVGSLAPHLNFPEKQSAFVGHLFVDKLKQQMQREKRDAVSTSHCSQPNTIEYEMAMEWRLLQSRADSWWEQLYKQQREELKKANAKLKSK